MDDASTPDLLKSAAVLRNSWGYLTYAVLANMWRAVAAHKVLAVVAFLGVFGIFAINAIRVGYSYSASASLLLAPPAYQSQGPSSGLMPVPLDIPSYARLLREDNVLAKVCQQLFEEDPQLWGKMQEAGTLVPDVLGRMIGIRTEVIEKTPQRVVYSRVISLSARSGKPEQAKHLIDVWTAVAIVAVREYSRPGSDVTVKFIQLETEVARKKLEAKEDELRSQEVAWNVPLLQLLKEEREKELAAWKGDLVTVQINLAEKTAGLEDVRKGLEKEDYKKVLKRFPSNDAITIVGATGDNVLENVPVFTDEVLNDAWVKLKALEADLSAEVGGLEARWAKIETEITSLEDEVKRLNEEFVTHSLKKKQLSREVQASEIYFAALAKQREEVAAIDASSLMEKAGSIILANAAVLPTRPNNLLTRWSRVPLGFVIAVIAAVALANFVHEIKRIQASQAIKSPASKASAD